MAHQVDGFVLTIDSDAELEADEEVSEDEQIPSPPENATSRNSKKLGNDLVVKDAKAKESPEETRKQPERNATSRGLNGSNGVSAAATLLKKKDDGPEEVDTVASGFVFEEAEDDSEEEEEFDGTIQESWDFTKTIERIKERENPAQHMTTTLDEKIRRKLASKAKGGVDSDDEEEEDEDEEEQDGSDEEGESEAEEDKGKVDTARPLGENSKTLQKQLKKDLMNQETARKREGAFAKEVSFVELNLSRPLIRAVQTLGFERPTPIQAKAIPFALAGRDVCGSAVTGSGKTAAFVLPVLERLLFRPKNLSVTRVVIITPTRELTQQVHSMAEKLSQFTDIRACAIVGGLSVSQQATELRSRPDIIVATPGRLIDHVRNSKSVDLDDVEILILDEADRLLELGFMDEVTEIVKYCPKKRQTLLFSATMTTSVKQLAELSLNKPVRIEADPLYDMASRLTQEFVRVREDRECDREGMLLALCKRSFKAKTIIFFSRKRQAHRMGIIFGLCGLKAGELHGNLTQRQRLEALQKFRDQDVDYLLCTDLASRGLDIKGVDVVLNFEMPKDMSTYVHRVGRTARAGRGGIAVTLAGEKQRKMTKEVLKRSKQNVKSRTIPNTVVEKMREKISSLEGDIKAILQEEKVEREMRLAEMEATKADNMMNHREEIMSRPARTWFQSEREKQMTKEATLKKLHGEEEGNEDEGPTGKNKKNKKEKPEKPKVPHRLTRKKRRRLELLAEEEEYRQNMVREAQIKAQNEGTKLEDDEVRKLGAKTETVAIAAAKEAKRLQKQKLASMGREEINRGEPDAVGKKKKKRGNKSDSLGLEQSGQVKKRVRYTHANEIGGFNEELSRNEGLNLIDKRPAKKKSKRGNQSLVFKEADLSKGGLRKGGKLGSNKFKSKAKYKRKK